MNRLPERWNDWTITPVLLWYHCQAEGRSPVWLHASEIPDYQQGTVIKQPTSHHAAAFTFSLAGANRLFMNWWLKQRLEP